MLLLPREPVLAHVGHVVGNDPLGPHSCADWLRAVSSDRLVHVAAFDLEVQLVAVPEAMASMVVRPLEGFGRGGPGVDEGRCASGSG